MGRRQVECPKHVGVGGKNVCQHIKAAVTTHRPCPGIEYRYYSSPEMEVDGWYCANCLRDHQPPPHQTSFAEIDAMLDKVEGIWGPQVCRECFEEWCREGLGREDSPEGFLDPQQFPFVAALESQWEAIRDEYLALPTDTFDPWVQGYMHGGGWTVYGLFAVGQQIPAACARCPRTAEVLAQIPGLSMAGFSRLAPKTHVKPHVGWAESVYRLHLALVVPSGCRIRVSTETRTWQEGKCLIFDDTIEHEAWNDSELPRGVLLLDFLRPGITVRVEDHVPEEVQYYVKKVFSAR